MKPTTLRLLLLLGASALTTAALAQNDGPRRPRNDDGPPPPRARESDRVRESDRAPRPPGPADEHRAHARPEDSRRGPQAGGPPSHGDRRQPGRPDLSGRDRNFGPPPGGFRPPFAAPQFCPHCGHALTPQRPDFRGPAARRFTSKRHGPAFSPDRDRPQPPRDNFGPSRRNQDAPGRPVERGDDRLRHDRREEQSDRQPPPRDDRDRKDRRHNDDDRRQDQRPPPASDRRR